MLASNFITMFYIIILMEFRILGEEKLPCSLGTLAFTVLSLVKHRGENHIITCLFPIGDDKVCV